jgi:hypothetical protein
MRRLCTIFLLIASATGCVIDNRPSAEGGPQLSEVDQDGTSDSSFNTAPETNERCADEDDLYDEVPRRLPIGFQRSDLYLCPDQTDVFELAADHLR